MGDAPEDDLSACWRRRLLVWLVGETAAFTGLTAGLVFLTGFLTHIHGLRALAFAIGVIGEEVNQAPPRGAARSNGRP
jgi:hypothetical protein